MKKSGSATEPLWYKDAIIYELHVRAFCDSNNDGIGDFQGLISRLDYLQDLGITCIWILPFFPSPLRDDGYDISDYTDVNPAYGKLEDFKQFLDEAHNRDMQVMIELVINHTSDQHPWFQAARHSPKGSPERQMYVWSDDDRKYEGVRIIFTDTEKSNWTWDEQAGQFYWHRFFSHQPDLNFDNPKVMDEVLKAMRFWLNLGVDALRLDAIPYLIERDGTSCENVPETHDKIRQIRAVIDAEYSNRLILAEANMWPADVRPYFGDADECHMAFHFPLMPRIYMALRQEDRSPITDIMAQTPEIPESCQWGLFLRNHDELTLEMVTDDERDYMYFAYSADPRMRINVGIRRRLAPLMDNNRRRIELLNSLLLSFPGTPILYYGDELGMGDNIYLGDRNGVRTPMQWNSDRNAGFSKCDPARLYFPIVMDPIYGYQVVNVEAQLSDQSSLLHWTRNMIALRKLFRVFGRGTLDFLQPDNRRVLAYIRKLMRDDGSYETVLCIANLSRFAQPAALNLSEYCGAHPVEMLGYVSFPRVTNLPYFVTLAPYSFLWLELQTILEEGEQESVSHSTDAERRMAEDLVRNGWNILSNENYAKVLCDALADWIAKQRWFGSKAKAVEGVKITSWIAVPTEEEEISISDRDLSPKEQQAYDDVLLFAKLVFQDGRSDSYQLPLALSVQSESSKDSDWPSQSIIMSINISNALVTIHDATYKESFRQSLVGVVVSDAEIVGVSKDGAEPFVKGINLRQAADKLASKPSRVSSAQQSNTSFIYSQSMMFKLFRRLEPGPNPDIEIGRFLTEVANFQYVPLFLGNITLDAGSGEPIELGFLQTLVSNEGDGWEWSLREIARFFESVADKALPSGEKSVFCYSTECSPAAEALEHAGIYLEAASTLGRRTAELHLALSVSSSNSSFSPEPFTAEDFEVDSGRIERQINIALAALKLKLFSLKDEVADSAAAVLSQRLSLFSQASALRGRNAGGVKIRIHGDYHLGQVLRSKGDFFIIDFEGEPARPMGERREKQSPIKDVAGMLRSFSYVANAGVLQFSQRRPEKERIWKSWARLWQNSASIEFLRGYRATISRSSSLLPNELDTNALLNAYLLEKALYELVYELNNRPEWVGIPLNGILSLVEL